MAANRPEKEASKRKKKRRIYELLVEHGLANDLKVEAKGRAGWAKGWAGWAKGANDVKVGAKGRAGWRKGWVRWANLLFLTVYGLFNNSMQLRWSCPELSLRTAVCAYRVLE